MGGVGEHWFWWGLTVTALVWYSTITVYVAVKAISDIKGMLSQLRSRGDDAAG